MPRSQGTGKILENFVVDIFASKNYLEVPRVRFEPSKTLEQPIFAKQFHTGTNIYNKNRYVDFIAYHPVKQPQGLVIQCKWQSSSGSVEEKYPFEVLSIFKDTIPAIVILDGGGYSEGAKNWLVDQANNGSYLIGVFDQGEFIRWSKNRL